ncbi:16938_t:CDS:2 [Gigaspora margarita]|uniref:16938_t:CDS:1 n=1 Tax=Gigaspora margarita TaxID=4874 RepID=A0ABN7UGJ1_GIGMA|nr:16938_t:CDS:2 [Gigaspora margarita]
MVLESVIKMGLVKNKMSGCYQKSSKINITLDIKSANETSDNEDEIKSNCKMKITRVCKANADMCRNTDNVNIVRGLNRDAKKEF